jgi:hypothetical protein
VRSVTIIAWRSLIMTSLLQVEAGGLAIGHPLREGSTFSSSHATETLLVQGSGLASASVARLIRVVDPHPARP